MTKQEAIEQFYELLLDPDPASMDVALDIAEANGLKLAELGHAMALSSPTNLRGLSAGWAEVGTSSRGFASTGEFRLSPSEEPGSPEYMAVGWIVWGDQSAARAEWAKEYHAHRYSFEVQVDYGGAEWLEGLGGVRGRFVQSLAPSRRRDVKDLPPIVEGADTKAVAERKAIQLAWQIGKLLKEAVQSYSDPLDVIIWLHEDKVLEETEPFTKRREYPPPPRAVVNPRAAGDLRRAAKPVRSYRPQKVVAELQKDARPEFSARTIGSPEDVASAMIEYMGNRAHEYFVAIFVNIRNGLVGYSEFTGGSTHGVEVFGSGIMREALAAGAAGIVTAHQHPSGNATPSAEDFALWERLKEIGKIVGIPIVDNMVIGDGEYYSESMGQRVQFAPLRRGATP